MGRKGGTAPRKGRRRTAEYYAGYKAGWVACERFWRQQRARKAA